MSAKQRTVTLSQSKRIVIKVGSSLLVDDEYGTIHRNWLSALADDVAQLRARGQEVLIVSSGAIAVGRRHLKFSDGNLRLEEKQAAAELYERPEVHSVLCVQEADRGCQGCGFCQLSPCLKEQHHQRKRKGNRPDKYEEEAKKT